MPSDRIESMDLDWFKEAILQQYKNFLFTQKIVQISKSHYKSLSEITLPYDKDPLKSKKLCEICRDFYKNKFPEPDLLNEWVNIYK